MDDGDSPVSCFAGHLFTDVAMRNNVSIGTKTDCAVFVNFPAMPLPCVEYCRGTESQVWLFPQGSMIDSFFCCSMDPFLFSNSPCKKISVRLFQSRIGISSKEAFPHKIHGFLNFTFSPGTIGRGNQWFKLVVNTEGVEELIPLHGAGHLTNKDILHSVIKDFLGNSTKKGKSPDMAVQKFFHRPSGNQFHIELPGITKDHSKQINALDSVPFSIFDFEIPKINLGLFTRFGFKSDVGFFPQLSFDFSDQPPHLIITAYIS